MEENENKKPHIVIGSIGHGNYGRKSLINAINKALKEDEIKKSKKKDKQNVTIISSEDEKEV